MSFDNSRNTFNPFNDYSAVVMEQGRVQTDADWNEWLAQQQRRTQAGTLDALGAAVYPATTPFAFQINPTAAKTSVTIGRGRMYVDGILVENHGDPTKASWDPALAELSGSPQPPPTTDANPVDFTAQLSYPGAKLPTAAGDYLCYLDVWQQPVTSIEDSSLIDAAIGVDTTGRLKTMWRVDFQQPAVAGQTCATAALSNPVSAGQLSNGTVTSGPSGPCCLTTGSGYTGIENQFYRVEIHNPGNAGGTGAFFKWSRENASVQTTLSKVTSSSNTAGQPASMLTVASLGHDQILGFSAGNWVEIVNDTDDKLCQPGTLYQIDSVDAASLTITLTTTLSTLPAATDAYTRIIRWDQSGKVYQADGSTLVVDLDALSGTVANGVAGIPVPTDGSSVILENGVTVTFSKISSTGVYLPKDFWNFSARTATGLLDPLIDAPPRGQHHHRAALSIVTIDASGNVTNATDCRTPIPTGSSDSCGCCTATVGTGGQYTTIKDALASLPAHGGEVCLLPGTLYEDVVLSGLKNIVIHGCEWQTQVLSASLDPNAATSSSSGTTTTPISQTGFPAVFTIIDCVNIELRDFTIRADTGAVGVLLDRTPDRRSNSSHDASEEKYEMVVIGSGRGSRDVILEDLIVEASTLPAIIAVSVNGLNVLNNRVFMKDVRSLWGAVYLAGDTIYFRHNWVGIGTASQFVRTTGAQPSQSSDSTASLDEKLPASSNEDVSLDKVHQALATTFTKAAKAPGGIHIGGPSKDVFIVENEIAGGLCNGITLGNFILLDTHGHDSGALTGVRWTHEADCSPGGTVEIPGTHEIGNHPQRIVAGGLIENLHIDRNSIHQTGMAGIGMVGFWNLRKAAEVIGIVNLSITANTISNTMLRRMAPIDTALAGLAYAAITLADVDNLIIRDNTITDFGETPAADVCGIFLLHGQLVEISRNQIRETRDWDWDDDLPVKKSSKTRAGISILLVTPPTVDSSTDSDVVMRAAKLLDVKPSTSSYAYRPDRSPLYQDGLPALRIHENVVRVAFDLALLVFGYGPFSFVGNHLSSGGYVYVDTERVHESKSDDTNSNIDPLLVEIFNLGVGIEYSKDLSHFSDLLDTDDTDSIGTSDTLVATGTGAILFTNNVCQLEAQNSGVTGLCSVAIITLDDLIFNSNHLWIDGPEETAAADGFVLAVTTQVSNNRFQEQRHTVLRSAATLGFVANITANNIASMPLKIGAPASRKIDSPNVTLF